MPYTNFITAIDLGTSNMVGVVGVKNPGGTLSIIAHEVESSDTCIRRGCVYNVKETANKIKRLISKLESKLEGAKIGKVYVGVGGMSLRSIDHIVPHILGEDEIVSEETVHTLYNESLSFRPDMLEVLAAVSPTYYIDNQHVVNPVGIPGRKIEAHYKLIVARPSLRNYIINSFKDITNVEIAGILVSPLAMADVVLSEDEKNLGCALINFGAGVTTLNIYKGGKLENLFVIPLGSHLITKDIMSLHIVEAEAERIKQTYGSAVVDSENESSIKVSSADGIGMREIPLSDLNEVVEARMREILGNVYTRLDETGLRTELGGGVVITGGGSALKNLTATIREQLQTNVRCSGARKGIVISGDIDSGNIAFATAIGLLMQGKENCALSITTQSEQQAKLFDIPEEPVKPPVHEAKPPKHQKEKNKKGGFVDELRKKVDNITRNLFDEG